MGGRGWAGVAPAPGPGPGCIPHQQRVLDGAVLADEGAHADDGVGYGAARPHHAPVAQDAVAHLRVQHLAGRQEAAHRVDGAVLVVEAAHRTSPIHRLTSTALLGCVFPCAALQAAAATATGSGAQLPRRDHLKLGCSSVRARLEL